MVETRFLSCDLRMILFFALFEDLGHLLEIKYGLVSPKLYHNIKQKGLTWKLGS